MQDNKTTKTPIEINTKNEVLNTRPNPSTQVFHQKLHIHSLNNHKIWKFQDKYQIQYVGSHKYKIETKKIKGGSVG